MRNKERHREAISPATGITCCSRNQWEKTEIWGKLITTEEKYKNTTSQNA
jgi:hypothetical protein